MKLCFVSVNGPREPYFVDEPGKYSQDTRPGMLSTDPILSGDTGGFENKPTDNN
jgi:hypothetical protein